MSQNAWERRDFLKSLLAGMPLLAWDWSSFPRGGQDKTPPGTYDAIVIGAGLRPRTSFQKSPLAWRRFRETSIFWKAFS